jgi:hypothetical protein
LLTVSFLLEPAVKRPQALSRGKKKSAARISFAGSDADSSSQDGGPVAAKKPGLSRIAIERSAARHAGLDSERPSYSKDDLRDLQQSTPSTPKDSEDDDPDKALSIAAKFGPLAKLGNTGGFAIPTDAEIREKKERRARLAKEQEYISLHGTNSDDERTDLMLRTKEKYPETRLVADDEDVAEGFDEFVEDPRIALGKKSERELGRQRRAEMAARIDEAEGAGSAGPSDEDDSEAERNAAYEAKQARAGTYARDPRERAEAMRPRTPPRVAPIPEAGGVLEQLRGALEGMRGALEAKRGRLAELAAEKADVAEREAWVQEQLRETGERYEKLRGELGLGAAAANGAGLNGQAVERGLDTLGGVGS